MWDVKYLILLLIQRYEKEDLRRVAEVIRNKTFQKYLVKKILGRKKFITNWAGCKYFKTTNCRKMD